LNRESDDREPDVPPRRPTGGMGPRPAPGGARGPKPVAEILGDLFAARGLARVRALGELEAAWSDAIGEPGRRQTRVDGLRRGVLSITVAHPTLLEELASFQKPNLLVALRRSMGGTPIHDIRFRIGPVDRADPPPPPGRAGRGRS
jgi:predicted nucleic acid-binding Zn ribbon protein